MKTKAKPKKKSDHRKIVKALESMSEPLPKLNREQMKELKRLKKAFPHTPEWRLRYCISKIEFAAGQIALCFGDSARKLLGIEDREAIWFGRWNRGFDRAIAGDIITTIIDGADHYLKQIKADEFWRPAAGEKKRTKRAA